MINSFLVNFWSFLLSFFKTGTTTKNLHFIFKKYIFCGRDTLFLTVVRIEVLFYHFRFFYGISETILLRVENPEEYINPV